LRAEGEQLRTDNSRLRDELAQAWGLTDADTEAARTAEIEGLRAAIEAEERAMPIDFDKVTLIAAEIDRLQRAALHTDDPSGRTGRAL
jgi:hypothetical protein